MLKSDNQKPPTQSEVEDLLPQKIALALGQAENAHVVADGGARFHGSHAGDKIVRPWPVPTELRTRKKVGDLTFDWRNSVGASG
jgi:hypothetical protein